jgi:hypothetical protein
VSERGQASIEVIGVVLLVVVMALGGWDMLSALRARDQAHRMVDQALVLHLEGKPFPAALRSHVRVSGRTVTAAVKVCAITADVGCFWVTAQGRTS